LFSEPDKTLFVDPFFLIIERCLVVGVPTKPIVWIQYAPKIKIKLSQIFVQAFANQQFFFSKGLRLTYYPMTWDAQVGGRSEKCTHGKESMTLEHWCLIG
jgi:hypothetical protein